MAIFQFPPWTPSNHSKSSENWIIFFLKFWSKFGPLRGLKVEIEKSPRWRQLYPPKVSTATANEKIDWTMWAVGGACNNWVPPSLLLGSRLYEVKLFGTRLSFISFITSRKVPQGEIWFPCFPFLWIISLPTWIKGKGLVPQMFLPPFHTSTKFNGVLSRRSNNVQFPTKQNTQSKSNTKHQKSPSGISQPTYKFITGYGIKIYKKNRYYIYNFFKRNVNIPLSIGLLQ